MRLGLGRSRRSTVSPGAGRRQIAVSRPRTGECRHRYEAAHRQHRTAVCRRHALARTLDAAVCRPPAPAPASARRPRVLRRGHAPMPRGRTPVPRGCTPVSQRRGLHCWRPNNMPWRRSLSCPMRRARLCGLGCPGRPRDTGLPTTPYWEARQPSTPRYWCGDKGDEDGVLRDTASTPRSRQTTPPPMRRNLHMTKRRKPPPRNASSFGGVLEAECWPCFSTPIPSMCCGFFPVCDHNGGISGWEGHSGITAISARAPLEPIRI
jgi:hypothetical protein